MIVKRWFCTIGFAIYFFIAYTVFYGGLVFNLPMHSPSDLNYDKETLKTAIHPDTKAYILDDLKTSFDARLALIEAAETSIKISYYSIHEGESRDIFYGALLAAADRGITVEIIIDYIFYYQTRGSALPNKALYSHENIDFRLYEPYQPWQPYTLHNRLHDKMMIIDESHGLLGGRNIGDRYYVLNQEEDHANKTFDRDILVFSSDTNPTVLKMQDYYEELFDSPYTVKRTHTPNEKHLNEQIRLKARYQDYSTSAAIETLLTTIEADAIAVQSAHFLRSPLDRFHKQPVVLKTLSALANDYDRWVVQSPYIIFHRFMLDALPKETPDDFIILTNAQAVTANVFAMSGYQRYRPYLAREATLYEYQGPGSIHAKGMIFGDEISVIGSLNLDPRSATLSTESVILIVSNDFAQHYQTILESYISSSLEVMDDGSYVQNAEVEAEEISRFKDIAIRLIGVFTRFMDVML